MRIVIPSDGNNLDAATSAVFGRCQYFIFVDPESLDYEVMVNPAVDAPGGAGVQAAQTILQKEVGAVLAPNLGPNAFRVIQMAGVQAFYLTDGTVLQNVNAYKAKSLQPVQTPGPDHVGVGRGRSRGRGR